MKCNHYACRCARAAELASLTDRTGDPRYLYEATQMREVECRDQRAVQIVHSPQARTAGDGA